MATATPAKTTTPRTRTTRTTKTTAPKVVPTAEVETSASEAPKTDRFVVALEYERDTKRYAKFNVPAALEGTMAGSIYAPLGTDTVKIAIMGVAGDSSDEE